MKKNRELLTKQGFDGANTPVIRGSGLKALEEADNSGPYSQKVLELANAMDTYIPMPERDVSKPFLMPIEDIFSIEGRGTVVTGKIERGVVKVGEEVEIVGIKDTVKTTVTGIEMFNKTLKKVWLETMLVFLSVVSKKKMLLRGQVLAKTGSVTPHSDFECEVYILKRKKVVVTLHSLLDYKPQFYIRTTDVTGECTHFQQEQKWLCQVIQRIKLNVKLSYSCCS